MGRPHPARRFAAALAVVAALLAPAAAHAGTRKLGHWKDVPAKFWAGAAVNFTGAKHAWMRDYGATHFRPDGRETRKYLAHAMVMAFAPHEPVDRRIHFGDLARTDPFYPYADVAVKLHWLSKVNGNFLPDRPVTMTDVHVALVQALGLGKVAFGFSHIHTGNGHHFTHPAHVGSLEIGMLLGLRYNHQNESLDVEPSTDLDRAEVAWSLYRAYVAKTQESWRISYVQGYAHITLPSLSRAMRKVVAFGLHYVGYPYVYAGDWARPTASGYCCGTQPVGGFDCSGLAWWLLKAPSGGYDNTRVRPYDGWSLPQRSSADMAANGRAIPFRRIQPGDLLFYSGAGNGRIDHVDTYIGSGYALDSSDGIGGVTVLRVNDGWYRRHFVQARRIIPR